MDKVDSMQEQMGNVSRETEILRKNQQEMIKINTIIEIKNVFDGLINDWKWLKKPPKKIEGISVETYKTRRKRKEKRKTKQNIQKLWDNYKRSNRPIIETLLLCHQGSPT